MASAADNRSMSWLTFRMSAGLKRQLETVAAMGERPQGWIVHQALLRLFRDLETGDLRIPEIAEEDPGPGIEGRTDEHGSMSLTSAVPPPMGEWLERLKRRSGTRRAWAIRVALVRYLRRRTAILRGERELHDDLRERGPDIPP